MALLTSNSLHAERERGLVFSETFRNSSKVVENGGTITGTPIFDNGVVLDGSGDNIKYAVETNLWKDEISFVFRFTPDFAWNEASTIYFFDTENQKYRFIKRTNVDLYLTLGATNVTITAAAGFSSYWKQNKENIFVITSKSGDTSIWLNGNLIDDSDTTAWSSAEEAELTIGSRSSDSSFFDGTIHEVKVFNKQLTDQEAEDYSNGRVWNYENEAAHIWPMDLANHDPTNDRSLDIKGNNHGVWNPTANTPTKNSDDIGYWMDGDLMTLSDITVGTNDCTVVAMIRDDEGSGVGYDGIIASQTTGAGILSPLYFTASTGALRMNLNGTAYTASSKMLSDGLWHVVGITYDRDGNATFYSDGEIDGTADISAASAVSLTMSTLQIGRAGSVTYLVGHLAHGFIWNDRALTPMQMKDLSTKLFRGINRL